MIATFVQDDLRDELSKIFAHFRLRGPDGEVSQIKIFEQSLPVPEAQDIPDTVTDEELEEGTYDAKAKYAQFPYIIVRIIDGEILNIDAEQSVDIQLLIGVVDRSHDNQGHKDVLNIIQKIYERFSKNPILAHKYECMMPIQWALQEEESFPFFFGGMALRFETAPITREDTNI